MTDPATAQTTPQSATELRHTPAQVTDVADTSVTMVMRQVDAAMKAGDLDQARALVALAREIQSPPEPPSEARQRTLLNRARIATVLALIVALFGVIIWALASGQSDATQFATPISGLAGIAIGWLFTSDPSRQSR